MNADAANAVTSGALPVAMVVALMGKRLWHDPRKRECRLASLTTLTYVGDDLESITYSEPAAVLLAQSHGGPG